MAWEEHYCGYQEAKQARRNQEAYERLQEARKRVARNTEADWEWLNNALADPAKKWFVASIFKSQPVPKRLFDSMMHAALVDCDASTNQYFIRPCLETFGRLAVGAYLDRAESSGSSAERSGVQRARYWAGRDPDKIRGL